MGFGCSTTRSSGPETARWMRVAKRGVLLTLQPSPGSVGKIAVMKILEAARREGVLTEQVAQRAGVAAEIVTEPAVDRRRVGGAVEMRMEMHIAGTARRNHSLQPL